MRYLFFYVALCVEFIVRRIYLQHITAFYVTVYTMKSVTIDKKILCDGDELLNKI